MAETPDTPRPHEEWERERQVVARMRERLDAWTPADGDFETHCAFLRDAADVLSIYWREQINAEIDSALAKHVLGDDRRSYSFWERIWRVPSNPEHQSLSDWLFTATRGLNTDSLPRIEEEISAHYRDVFESAMQSGATPTGAHRDAIRSLGNSRQARKEFHKVHLTRAESELLEKAAAMSMSTTSKRRSLLDVVLTLFVLGYLYMAIPDSALTRETLFWSAGVLWFASGLLLVLSRYAIRMIEPGRRLHSATFGFAGMTDPNHYFWYPTAAMYITLIGTDQTDSVALLAIAYVIAATAAIMIILMPLSVGRRHWRAVLKQRAAKR